MGSIDVLELLLIWALTTFASTCALLLILAVDEAQVRTRTTVDDTRSTAVEPAGHLTPQAA